VRYPTSRPTVVLALVAFALFALASRSARAAAESHVQANVTEPPRRFVELRVGPSTGSQNHRPEICLEAAPLAALSFEACGTGSGFLHHEPEPEIAHFRSELRIMSWQVPAGWLELSGAAGFAELQIGEDSHGFHFSGTDPRRIETAGPEIAASARFTLSLSRSIELVGKTTLGLAWMEHAPDLIVPQPKLQPDLNLTLGFAL
jgi:hypothetical protein